jgi:hypothetical protein
MEYIGVFRLRIMSTFPGIEKQPIIGKSNNFKFSLLKTAASFINDLNHYKATSPNCGDLLYSSVLTHGNQSMNNSKIQKNWIIAQPSPYTYSYKDAVQRLNADGILSQSILRYSLVFMRNHGGPTFFSQLPKIIHYKKCICAGTWGKKVGQTPEWVGLPTQIKGLYTSFIYVFKHYYLQNRICIHFCKLLINVF